MMGDISVGWRRCWLRVWCLVWMLLVFELSLVCGGNDDDGEKDFFWKEKMNELRPDTTLTAEFDIERGVEHGKRKHCARIHAVIQPLQFSVASESHMFLVRTLQAQTGGEFHVSHLLADQHIKVTATNLRDKSTMTCATTTSSNAVKGDSSSRLQCMLSLQANTVYLIELVMHSASLGSSLPYCVTVREKGETTYRTQKNDPRASGSSSWWGDLTYLALAVSILGVVGAIVYMKLRQQLQQKKKNSRGGKEKKIKKVQALAEQAVREMLASRKRTGDGSRTKKASAATNKKGDWQKGTKPSQKGNPQGVPATGATRLGLCRKSKDPTSLLAVDEPGSSNGSPAVESKAERKKRRERYRRSRGILRSPVGLCGSGELEDSGAAGGGNKPLQALTPEQWQGWMDGLRDRGVTVVGAENLILHDRIGAGSHGNVFRAEFKGNVAAAKQLSRASLAGARAFRREVELLHKLNHDNVLSLLALGVIEFDEEDSKVAGSVEAKHQEGTMGTKDKVAEAEDHVNVSTGSGSSGAASGSFGNHVAMMGKAATAAAGVVGKGGAEESGLEVGASRRKSSRYATNAVMLPRMIYMITEYVGGGDLFRYLTKLRASLPSVGMDLDPKKVVNGMTLQMYRQPPLGIDQVWFWAKDICRGMHYLHEVCLPQILHRDLKSPNILVRMPKPSASEGDARASLVLCDFGLSKEHEQTFANTLVGTVRWSAPEVLRGEKYSSKADVFSVGVVLWELYACLEPYPGLPVAEVARRVCDGERLYMPVSWPPRYRQIISRCWHNEPEKRPSFSELVKLLDDDQLMKPHVKKK